MAKALKYLEYEDGSNNRCSWFAYNGTKTLF